MSVAFRRESDEEHKEPKFEIPLPAGPNLVTARGQAMIAARIVALETELAGAGGDEAEALRRDLRYWHTRRTTAQPTRPPEDGTAGFGTRVAFRLNGKDRVIEIVGDDEADPSVDRIAWSAPLARALIGGEAGETIDFNGKAAALTVVSVEPIEP